MLSNFGNILNKSSGSKCIQAALVIRGFAIRGFDYLRPVNCPQNSLSADISLDYPRILIFFNGKNVI